MRGFFGFFLVSVFVSFTVFTLQHILLKGHMVKGNCSLNAVELGGYTSLSKTRNSED